MLSQGYVGVHGQHFFNFGGSNGYTCPLHTCVFCDSFLCSISLLLLSDFLSCILNSVLHTVWVTKKFPFFETRYRATVILHSVFVSVPFYNFPCFYCCVSVLKVQRKER